MLYVSLAACICPLHSAKSAPCIALLRACMIFQYRQGVKGFTGLYIASGVVCLFWLACYAVGAGGMLSGLASCPPLSGYPCGLLRAGWPGCCLRGLYRLRHRLRACVRRQAARRALYPRCLLLAFWRRAPSHALPAGSPTPGGASPSAGRVWLRVVAPSVAGWLWRSVRLCWRLCGIVAGFSGCEIVDGFSAAQIVGGSVKVE